MIARISHWWELGESDQYVCVYLCLYVCLSVCVGSRDCCPTRLLDYWLRHSSVCLSTTRRTVSVFLHESWTALAPLVVDLLYSNYYILLHPFNGLFSRTYWVRRHQKGKPFWILLEQEMMGWQWHQLDHMQITCTSLQTHNHASTSPLSFYRPDTLPTNSVKALKADCCT